MRFRCTSTYWEPCTFIYFQVFLFLLKMYLSPPDPKALGVLAVYDTLDREPNLQAAMKLLQEHANHLDTAKVRIITKFIKIHPARILYCWYIQTRYPWLWEVTLLIIEFNTELTLSFRKQISITLLERPLKTPRPELPVDEILIEISHCISVLKATLVLVINIFTEVVQSCCT